MAFIKDSEINQIRQNADIVDIISDYLPLTKKGKNYVTICPFHDDHTPSMVVSPEKQIFNCFTCRTGGNVFAFLMKYENVSYAEAIAIVAKKIGYNLNIESYSDKNSKFSKEYEIYKFATKYFANNLFTEKGNKAKEYLNKRGIDESIIKEFNIGLSLNNKNDLYNILNKKYDSSLLEDIGLINKSGLDAYDVFTNRIMIPITNPSGQVVGFTGRIYEDVDQAKYINTKETVIYKKSSILFNYYNAKSEIRNAKKVIVVEGNMDAIKLAASGIKNVVALMGVALSKEQIDILKKLKVPVILMFDNDSAGLDATLKLGQLLIDSGVDTQVVRLSGAKDPDEYIRAKGADALKDNIEHAKKYLDFKLEYLKNDRNLNNIEELIEYIRLVLDSLKNQDEFERDLILSKISNDYNIDINVLKKQISKENKPIDSPKVEKKVRKNRYDIAVSKILYAMMNDSKYITIYNNRLGYFKNKIDRIIASEIVYYNKEHKSINIADFVSFIMTNDEIYDKVLTIINQNESFEVSDNEFNDCIDMLLELQKKEEINLLKEQIKKEMDENKKVELLSHLAQIKKGSVENE